jgi:iron transport multicopper oxidase
MAGFNNVTFLMQKVPSLFTAMTIGATAENPVVYGVNANAFVVKSGQLVEIVIDTCSHPIHLHGHAGVRLASPGTTRH